MDVLGGIRDAREILTFDRKISLTVCKSAWYKVFHEISRRSSGVEQLIRNQ